jgi:hypothetical protein
MRVQIRRTGGADSPVPSRVWALAGISASHVYSSTCTKPARLEAQAFRLSQEPENCSPYELGPRDVSIVGGTVDLIYQ